MAADEFDYPLFFFILVGLKMEIVGNKDYIKFDLHDYSSYCMCDKKTPEVSFLII